MIIYLDIRDTGKLDFVPPALVFLCFIGQLFAYDE